jgi:hypothetical protein
MLVAMILRKLGESVSRRNFLAKTVMACAAVALGTFGFVEPAMAGCGEGENEVFCCCLGSMTTCVSLLPSNCPGGVWCWTCNYHTDSGSCVVYKCNECYSTGTYGHSGCTGEGNDGVTPDLKCSKAVPGGGSC